MGGYMKSNVSDFLDMIQAIYIDACVKYTANLLDIRDLKTIRSRVKQEGLSFLTITLPTFCKDFEKSLARGKIEPRDFREFKKHGTIPAFLWGMTARLFDERTGRILYDQQRHKTGAVAAEFALLVQIVRQICLAFKKVELPCKPQRVEKALSNFIQLEHSFSMSWLSIKDIELFELVSFMLWSRCLATFSLTDCTPRHGPGATADGRRGNAKYIWRNWNDRLESTFPLIGSGYPLGVSPGDKELENVTIVKPEQEQPVKVTPVPKTLKGPRIIAIEPCCMQFAQQGLRDWLYARIESYPLTAGHVNFRDQSINRELALISSSTGQFVTIDLSDASDRVPLSLVRRMFHWHPEFLDAVESCRTTAAEMPWGEIISPLAKFASMGSALCFPIEAMYFYTICVEALLVGHNLPVTYENCLKVSRGIYVYGDDIIVPTDDAELVLDYLQKYNCKVNESKTFLTGMFRESCGLDAFAGYEVTPTYIGTLRPENRRQSDRLISWVETGNAFYKKGFWRTAQYLLEGAERVLGPLPYVSETSEGLGRISYLGYRTAERWNGNLHRLEVKAWCPSPVYMKSKLDGYAALGASLNKLEGLRNPLAQRDPQHLERFALHGAVVLKRHWVPTH
jgi:hypothetical protein